MLEIIGNAFNVLGFLVLLSAQPFKDLYGFLTKKVDEFGHMPSWLPNKYNRKVVFDFKFRQPIGLILVFIGNSILLFNTIYAYTH